MSLVPEDDDLSSAFAMLSVSPSSSSLSEMSDLSRFRNLRGSWRTHLARLIASQGGPVEEIEEYRDLLDGLQLLIRRLESGVK
jgi:hypothetical protein